MESFDEEVRDGVKLSPLEDQIANLFEKVAELQTENTAMKQKVDALEAVETQTDDKSVVSGKLIEAFDQRIKEIESNLNSK